MIKITLSARLNNFNYKRSRSGMRKSAKRTALPTDHGGPTANNGNGAASQDSLVSEVLATLEEAPLEEVGSKRMPQALKQRGGKVELWRDRRSRGACPVLQSGVRKQQLIAHSHKCILFNKQGKISTMEHCFSQRGADKCMGYAARI